MKAFLLSTPAIKQIPRALLRRPETGLRQRQIVPRSRHASSTLEGILSP